MRIGIFDSGIGGEAIAIKLRELFPNVEILSFNDREHMPYGDRSFKDIINLTINAIKPIVDSDCDAIIVACNTATTVAISSLRSFYPGVNFIGIEPMIKPAAAISKTRCIAVCATPSTLKSSRYISQKNVWAKNINVIEPDCIDWAHLIEHGRSDEIDISSVKNLIKNNDVDVIVLGCTHYHWIKQRIIESAGKEIKVLEPSDAIVERIKNLIN